LSPHPTANATSGEALLRRPTGKTQAFCRKGARHCERNGVGRVSTPDLIRGPWRRSKALRSMPPSEYGISQRRHLESLSSHSACNRTGMVVDTADPHDCRPCRATAAIVPRPTLGVAAQHLSWR
jgi:hypothetical protein